MPNDWKHPEAHGGDLLRMATLSGRSTDDLLDFSVNIRPEGPPEYIRAALLRAMTRLSAYPSPHAEEAVEAAAKHHGMDASRFVFGNGSNELIHALARALRKRGTPAVCVIEPAFGEYALAAERAGLSVLFVWGGLPEHGTADISTDILLAPLSQLVPGTAVFLANPGNPSGGFRGRDACLALLAARPDLLWILDEAFIEYAGSEREASVLHYLPENGVVLRSLTKFHAVPGVRIGYLAASAELAAAVRAELPAWNVSAFGIAAARAVLEDTEATIAYAEQTRKENVARRADLTAVLAALPGVMVYPSAANYVLFRWKNAPRNLLVRLLQTAGIAIRDCANYHGLEDGSWFRASVRFPDEHRRLGNALRDLRRVSEDRPLIVNSPPRKPALMLQGTSSNAGKSILAAAYCRIFHQDGYDVAPFKAQNMSLNSGVTAAGDEMGRAQIVQAQAARVDPDARMNPILLKPRSDTGSQIIVLGQPIGHMNVREYIHKKSELWKTVATAYDELASAHEVMILEGAGSPGEINLKQHDVVNMRMADYAKASVLLVGDIDRGGVYASFLGTWMTFTSAERRLLTGYIVNRFRGDASLLAPAHNYLLAHTGVPVLGTIPHIPDLNIPEEDMAGFSWGQFGDPVPPAPGTLEIAVIMMRHVSNSTDFAPLALEPDVRVRPVRRVEEWGNPDVVMLPGSKSVVSDLEDLRRVGLADRILEHAAQNKWLFGICGGLQMLGQAIRDPHGIESAAPYVRGLGLMKLRSTFAEDKTLVRVRRVETPLGVVSAGYEIHHGLTESDSEALPLFLRADRAYPSEADRVCGYVSGRCWATYLHGIFDDDAFRRAWIDHVRADIGLTPQKCQLATYDLEKALDRLADIVREHSDMTSIYKSLGL